MNNRAANFSKRFTSSAMIIEAVDWGRFNTLTPLRNPLRSMGRARASHADQTVKTLEGLEVWLLFLDLKRTFSKITLVK